MACSVISDARGSILIQQMSPSFHKVAWFSAGPRVLFGRNSAMESLVEKPGRKKQRKTKLKKLLMHRNKISSNHFLGVFPCVPTSMACNILVVPYHHCFCWFKCYFSRLRPLLRPATLRKDAGSEPSHNISRMTSFKKHALSTPLHALSTVPPKKMTTSKKTVRVNFTNIFVSTF